MKNLIVISLTLLLNLVLIADETAFSASFQQLQQRIQQETEFFNDITQENRSIQNAFRLAAVNPNIDLRFQDYLKIQTRLVSLKSKIEQSTSQQASLAEALKHKRQNSQLTPQETGIMDSHLKTLHQLGLDLQSQTAMLKQNSARLRKMVASLPPPKRFKTQSGIEMILTGTEKAPFYISRSCISAPLFNEARYSVATESLPAFEPPEHTVTASVTYPQSVAFCQWLTDYEQAPFAVASLQQLQQAKECGMDLSQAYWTSTPWEEDSADFIRAQERFSLPMQTIFDPLHLLSEQSVTGDILQASYKELGLIVVTNVKTGLRYRLLQAQQAISEKENATPTP